MLFGLAFTPGAPADAQSDEQTALDGVREQIKALEQDLASQTAARDDGAAELKRVELKVAAAATELTGLRDEAARQRAKLRSLDEQTSQARARLLAERDGLARQVRLSYMNGREELFKLLLSQESPAGLGRMMVYYDYFNRARSERIKAAGEEIGTLTRLSQEGALIQGELDKLELARQAELAALQRSRLERGTLLAKLNSSIASSDGQIDLLREEETRLSQLLVGLGDLLAAFPTNSEEPFQQLQGRLAWPVPGRLTELFGRPRGGGPMQWNGVLLESLTGTSVRAIYHGRIAFSDWLPGLGLLIIVDHGDGYMSLYGHNQALLKESGDWVNPGETIAQVGDSGGQPEASLYFEIRRNGEPVDPQRWVAGRPVPVE